MLLKCLCVGCGGFVGSVLRYLCGLLGSGNHAFPFVTLGVNILGCFAILFLGRLLAVTLPLDSNAMLFVRVGLCGGFTTFSAFSAETLGMLQGGGTLQAIVYIVASVALCLGAAWLGDACAGRMVA